MITEKVIAKVYKKVKSNIYYSKNIFRKKMIVDFENSKNANEVFKVVAMIANGDIELLDNYLTKISIAALPKSVDNRSVKETGKTDDKIINLKDDKVHLKSVNFFIDAPIEIILLDALWTLESGKQVNNLSLIDEKVSYGNILQNFKLYAEDFCGREDFAGDISFFKPYAYQYRKWRDDAFARVNELIENQSVLLINYDIKQFYYNCRVSFKELAQLLDYNNESMLNVMEKIYNVYQEILKEYKKIEVVEDKYILPIGLYSSMLISNLVLSKYDKAMQVIVETNNGYYGRYVDDMIFVVPYDKKLKNAKNKVLKNVINEYPFLEFEKIEKKDSFKIPVEFIETLTNQNLSLNLNNAVENTTTVSNLYVNPEKIDIYYFDKYEPNVLSKIYESKMLLSVSDVGESIDSSHDTHNLMKKIFRYKDSSHGYKISDLKTTSIDKYEFSIVLTKLISFYKNVEFDPKDASIKEISEFFINLLSETNAIKYHDLYEKIFIFLTILGFSNIKIVKDKIEKVIDNLLKDDFGKENYINNKNVLELTKASLKQFLENCREECIALDSKTNCNNAINKKIKEKWLKSLIINRSYYSIPLIQLSADIKKIKMGEDFDFNFTLEKERKEYNPIPYKVNFEELYFHRQLTSLKKKEIINVDDVFEEFCKVNEINFINLLLKTTWLPFEETPRMLKDEGNYRLVELPTYYIKRKDAKEREEMEAEFDDSTNKKKQSIDKYKIGVVSIPLNEKDIF